MSTTPEAPGPAVSANGRGKGTPVLKLDAIHTFYGAIQALKGISI